MAEAFRSFIMHYGYLAVFVLIMVEDFGVPVPGETALVVASAAAAAGELNIWGVVVAAFVGAVIGDNIGFLIGHYGGRPLVLRVGGKLGITPPRLEKAEGLFTRYGDAIVAIARFVDVLRQLNGIIAGILGMHWAKFLAWNALGAALWVGTWAAVGYFAGDHMKQIEAWVVRFSWLLLAVGGVLIILAIFNYRRRRQAAEG